MMKRVFRSVLISVGSVGAAFVSGVWMYDHTQLRDVDIIAVSLFVAMVCMIVLSVISDTKPKKRRKKAVFVTLEPTYKLVEPDGHVVLKQW